MKAFLRGPISVVESKISFKIYSPSKPTKFGLKIFALSVSKNLFFVNFLEPLFCGQRQTAKHERSYLRGLS
ncbi:hypothetical protein C0J52_05886 [Blattella germanica]|nr:hypothetical protein C0J52_05886 [Blattella germanica]